MAPRCECGTVTGNLRTEHQVRRERDPGTTFKFSSANPGTFEVVLKSGGPKVSGKVSDTQSRPASGVAVFIVPADRDRLDLFRRTDTDKDGNFTFSINLLPGEYKVFSWEDADNNAIRDPDFLKRYEQFGKEIIVKDSSNSTVDVLVIPAQEPPCHAQFRFVLG